MERCPWAPWLEFVVGFPRDARAGYARFMSVSSSDSRLSPLPMDQPLDAAAAAAADDAIAAAAAASDDAFARASSAADDADAALRRQQALLEEQVAMADAAVAAAADEVADAASDEDETLSLTSWRQAERDGDSTRTRHA